MMPLLSIIVPTYNERENIPLLIERVKNALTGINFEMVIVDDDSPDETWKLAEELKKEYQELPSPRMGYH